MIKLTNIYLIGLLTAGLLVGCGGGSDNNNETNEGTGESTTTTTSTTTPAATAPATTAPAATTPPATPAAKTFTSDVMPVLNTKCKSCHGDNGRFTITTASGTYANISDLKASVTEAGKYLYDKGSNTIGHGGGSVISTASSEYATIKSWVDSGADFN